MERSSLLTGLIGTAGFAATQSGFAAQPDGVLAAATTSVNARAFGAKGDGKADDTKTLQAALDAATAHGPVCFVPAGLYRLDGALMVPPGVTLCGASGGVPHSEQPIGTVLLAFGGRGKPDAEPLVTLKPNAVVRNVVIHYPEQTLPEIAPYP